MTVTVLYHKTKPLDIEIALNTNEAIEEYLRMWNGEEGYLMIHGTPDVRLSCYPACWLPGLTRPYFKYFRPQTNAVVDHY